MVKGKHLKQTRILLILINFIAVLYNASLYLFATHYIVLHHRSHALLERLDVIPGNPVQLYVMAVAAASILCLAILAREYIPQFTEMGDSFIVVELLLMIAILVILHDSYNGVILLVFMDIIYHAQDNKHWPLLMIAGFASLLFSNYGVLSQVIDFPSLDIYLAFYPHRSATMLSFFRYFFESFNIVLFIVFLITYLMDSLEEKQHLQQEMQMVNQVNSELKNYVALSEKIAEDRERKRIAREIHDTLGHALTGIAAGVDACIVLIDVSPERAKTQLIAVSKVVREGIGDVRRSLNKLRPGALENKSLKAGLTQMIKEYEELSKVKIDLYYEWNHVDLDNTKEDVLFRVIQESITNSVRHGHARHIEINMFVEKDHYTIIIQDDGMGCEHIVYGYGLTQMKERLAIIGAKVEFMNINGFRTLVEIPKLKGEDEDDESHDRR